MRKLAAFFLTLAAICGAGWFYYSTNTLEARFFAVCEAAMKDRLKAPSTYSRISATFDHAELKLDEYIQEKYKQIQSASTEKLKEIYHSEIADAQAGKAKPTATRSTFTYDAANSYGTPIRSTSDCLYIDDHGTGEFFKADVIIDGQTNIDRTIEAIKKNP